MAFMMPVVRNDWELYDTKRSRQNSNSTSRRSSSNNLNSKSPTKQGVRKGGQQQRSMSYNVPNTQSVQNCDRYPQKSYHLSARNSRNASSTSFGTDQGHKNVRQLRVDANGSSINAQNGLPPKSPPPKSPPSSASINKFHGKVLDRLKNLFHHSKEDPGSKPVDNAEEGTEGIQTSESNQLSRN